MKKRWPFLIAVLLILVFAGIVIRFIGMRRPQSIWAADGHPSDVYAKAAFTILRDMPRKNIWPTPGNVIALLGQPSDCNLNGYQGDLAHRLDLSYKADKVSLGFSIRGPIESVVYFVKPQVRKGWGFPDDFMTSIPRSQWPYMSGTFRTHAPPAELMRRALEQAKGLKTEGDWYPVIMRHFRDYPPPETPEELNGIPSQSNIMIVDGLRDDLAVVTFSIKGKNQYWCDSWWHLSNGQWQWLPPHEGGRVLARME